MMERWRADRKSRRLLRLACWRLEAGEIDSGQFDSYVSAVLWHSLDRATLKVKEGKGRLPSERAGPAEVEDSSFSGTGPRT